MSNINFEETFCAAVDEIVTRRLQGLSFDTTSVCQIIDASKAEDGIYTVNDGSINFTAYSSVTTYEQKQWVYVTIPNNDREQQCIIIGKKLNSGISTYTFTSPFGTILDITENLIDIPIKNVGLTANFGLTENPNQYEEYNSDAFLSEVIYEISILIDKNKQLIDESLYQGIQQLYKKYDELLSSTYADNSLSQSAYRQKLNEARSAIYEYFKNYLSFIPIPNDSILNDENNNYNSENIQAITIWEYEPEYVIAGYERLGLKGEFQSLLKSLEAVEGNYGLRLLITANLDGPVTSGEKKSGLYELLLDAEDMNGDPYNFEGFFPQEKVFDISQFSNISRFELQFYQKPGSFKNSQGKAISIDVINNLFVQNAYLCLGYDLNSFGTDKVQIFSLQSPAYSSTAVEEDNKKKIVLRWLHQDVNKIVKSMTYEDILALPDSEIRWYRYELGAETSDEYSGLYWVRIPEDDPGFENGNLCEYNFMPDSQLNTEQLKVIIKRGAYYFFSNILSFYNEKEVINQKALAALSAFRLKCEDESSGNYYRYTQGGGLSNPAEANTERVLRAIYDPEGNDDSELTSASYLEWRVPINDSMIVIPDETYQSWETIPQYRKSADLVAIENKTYYRREDSPHYQRFVKPEGIVGKTIPPEMYYEIIGGKYVLTPDITFSNNVDYFTSSYYTPLNNIAAGTDLSNQEVYEYNDNLLCIRRHVNQTLDTTPGRQYTNYLIYKISPYYSQGYLNNTITAIAKIGANEQTYSYTFNFGRTGSSGSSYTLTLNIDSTTEPYLVMNKYKESEGQKSPIGLTVTARLFDYENKEIDISRGALQVYPIEECKDLSVTASVNNPGQFFVSLNRIDYNLEDNANIPMNTILVATLPQEGIQLTTYCSIPIVKEFNPALPKFGYTAAPTSIIYDTTGYIHYYRDILKCYDKEGNRLDIHNNVSWDIAFDYNGYLEQFKTEEEILAAIEENQIFTYVPFVYCGNDGCRLNPVTMYLENMPIPHLHFHYNDNVWSHPIIVLKNKYPSCAIDSWDGQTVKVNTASGQILSTMISAGSKNSKNEFSGVMMGDWSGACAESTVANQTGLYGFQNGDMSFAFMEDGTAFLGTSSGGRILFDGNGGVIKSANYAMDDQTGMSISLKEGHIDAFNFKLTSSNILIDSNPISNDYPYFNIWSNALEKNPNYNPGAELGTPESEQWVVNPNKLIDLIYISDDKYELRSKNYDDTNPEAVNGMKIDLKYGTINIGSKLAISSDGVITSEGGSFNGISISGGNMTSFTLGQNPRLNNNIAMINSGILSFCSLDSNCSLQIGNKHYSLSDLTTVSNMVRNLKVSNRRIVVNFDAQGPQYETLSSLISFDTISQILRVE